MSYCIVENGVIVNIAEADVDFAAAQGWIENQGWGIGWVRSGEVFVPPEPEQPEVICRQLTSLEYLDLFTESEQLAVVGATMSVPAVKLWYDRMLAASFVTYADPRTEAGLQALVDAELLTQSRKEEIATAMQN